MNSAKNESCAQSKKKPNRSWSQVTYRNRMKYGGGLRLRDPEKSDCSGSSEDEWDRRYYAMRRAMGFGVKKKRVINKAPHQTKPGEVPHNVAKVEVEAVHIDRDIDTVAGKCLTSPTKLYGNHNTVYEWVADSEPDSIEALLDQAL